MLVVAVRLRVIQRAFRNAGALSAGTAVPLAALAVRTRGLAIGILMRHGVAAAAERWRRRPGV